MFKEIRNKITFFNTMILVAFLIIFILIIIFIVRWSMVYSGESYLKEAAQQIITSSERNSNDNNSINALHNELGYNYLIWNNKLGIIEQSINDRELIEESYNLINEHQKDKSFYTSNISSGSYRIYMENFKEKDEDNILFVFQNITAENELIKYFITYLLIFGFIGILCLIPIAFILAGRSLVSIKRSYEEQKKFIADASHELRSPLNVIQTSVDVLDFKENETIKANKKWIDNISSECQNMSTLINDLTDIARFDNSQLIYANRDISVSQLCDEVVFLLESTAKEKNIIIDADIEPGINLYADSDKIRQLIRIFLDNAVKYSADNSTVKISLKKENNNIILKVKDKGIGISQEDINKIFDRFYRCDNARSRQVSGTGLGLNIARNISNYYKGKIDVKSKIGEGSEFTISIPNSN